MVNLRRAVVLICFVSFCIISIICGFISPLAAASASDLTIKGGSTLVGGETWVLKDNENTNFATYLLSPYLQFSYSASSFKSEIKFHFDVSKTCSFVLDKAYTRFRVPTFENKKLTIVAGKAPVSWGMGQLYRGGDILFSSPLSNEEAGQDKENILWVISASQPLMDDFSLELAFVPAVENIEKEKVGALLKFSPQLDYFKEVRLAYVYSDSNHKACALVDLNLYFDINMSLESSFRSLSDFRVVANLYKAFSIEGEYESHSLNLYVSYQGDFYEKKQDLAVALSYGLTDRTTITAYQSNSWSSGEYNQFNVSLYSTSNLASGVDITILGMALANPSSPSSGCTISAGARIKYSF